METSCQFRAGAFSRPTSVALAPSASQLLPGQESALDLVPEDVPKNKHIDFDNLEEEIAKIGVAERNRRTFAYDRRSKNVNKDFEPAFDADEL